MVMLIRAAHLKLCKLPSGRAVVINLLVITRHCALVAATSDALMASEACMHSLVTSPWHGSHGSQGTCPRAYTVWAFLPETVEITGKPPHAVRSHASCSTAEHLYKQQLSCQQGCMADIMALAYSSGWKLHEAAYLLLPWTKQGARRLCTATPTASCSIT